jgi:hypothetical protein
VQVEDHERTRVQDGAERALERAGRTRVELTLQGDDERAVAVGGVDLESW